MLDALMKFEYADGKNCEEQCAGALRRIKMILNLINKLLIAVLPFLLVFFYKVVHLSRENCLYVWAPYSWQYWPLFSFTHSSQQISFRINWNGLIAFRHIQWYHLYNYSYNFHNIESSVLNTVRSVVSIFLCTFALDILRISYYRKPIKIPLQRLHV